MICFLIELLLKSSLQVVFRGTYCIKEWSLLLFKEKERDELRKGCSIMEATVMELFNDFGWKFSYRIEA